MPEELFEIEQGIFSLSSRLPCGNLVIQEPSPAGGLVLLVQPFAGIPLHKEGMQKYVGTLYKHSDLTDEARQYEIRIKLLLAFCEWPLVTLEEAGRVEDWANLSYIKSRGEYGTGDSYIISVGEKELRHDSDFPTKLSNFLARFYVDEIEVVGRCDNGVMGYLSKLPSVKNGGIERQLRFVPSRDEHLIMTPKRNPLGYQKETPLSLKEKLTSFPEKPGAM